jgi:chemotaxis protein histidine kinase CheA
MACRWRWAIRLTFSALLCDRITATRDWRYQDALQSGAGNSGARRVFAVVVLHEVFNIKSSFIDFTQGIMVVLDADGAKAALFVDALVGQHQVVIKSLEANYRRVPGVSGATIMGDGHVAMILDVSAIAGMAKSNMQKAG